MASIRRHPYSPYWQACITLPDGTRTNRSTGTTKRRDAERIAFEYEDASREAKNARFTETRARKTIANIFTIANQEQLPSSTAADFLATWLTRKGLEATDRTHEKYSGVISQLTAHLGSKARRNITSITAADIAGFRDSLAKRLSIGTVNVALKIIRSAFAQARRDGLVDTNEAERVTTLKRRADKAERRPFTLEELKRILDVADGEWRGMILFGLYTGQRLGDIAALTWSNVDLQRQEVRLQTEKTGRRQIIPLAAPLLRYAENLPSSDTPGAPIFPKSSATVERMGRAAQLSSQFYDLLVSAGLAKKRTHHAAKGGCAGRSGKREGNPLSFHSLRHTATSLLKAAGVSDAVAMEFVGHDSATISRNYTHIETATLREAAAKLPDITK